VDATLYPADVPFLYFVARPDGSHIFTCSLVEHNRARAMLRQERQQRQAAEARAIGSDTPQSGGEAQ
jgi:UPF0755 protein